VPILLMLEVLATLVDIPAGGWGVMSTEERWNARAGVQLACGHIDAIWALQYKWNCGGCTVEAVLANPLFQALGPTVFAWKLVPGTIHVFVVLAGSAIAGRAAGARGAMLWVITMFAAPGFYRALALTGFGNHAESTVFGFVSAALLLACRDSPSRRRKVGTALIAGVVSGLGLWFGPTTLHLLPAVIMLLYWAGRWPAVGFFAGMPIGLVPGLAYMSARPREMGAAAEWFTTIQFAPPDAMVRWLFGDFITGSLWPAVPPLASAVWWFGLAAIAVVGMVVTPHRENKAWSARIFVPVALVSLTLAYFVRYDLWADNPAIEGFDPFNMRYRAPVFPLLAMAAATSIGPGSNERLRKICMGGMVVLVTIGIMLRVSAWRVGGTEPVHAIGVYAPDAVPDATVPEGDPPRRLPAQMGRMEDLAVAVKFLRSHSDPFPDCRTHHEIELGRRVGIAWLESPEQLIPGDILGTMLRSGDTDVRDHLAMGFARSVVLPNGDLDPRWTATGRAKLVTKAPDLARHVDRAAERLQRKAR
jgi:hypothetical protein